MPRRYVFRLSSALYEVNGEGGIRTLGTLLGYGALAKRCFRPLSHLTKSCENMGWVSSSSIRADEYCNRTQLAATQTGMMRQDQTRPDQRTPLRYLFKMLLRSRSWQFARQAIVRGIRSDSVNKLRWRGHDVFYRPGTSDMKVLYQVLLRKGRKAEYYVPRAIDPAVILDIGSNIGASVLYFRDLFPK